MTEAERDLANEMASPVFTNYDPERRFVVVCKDWEEGNAARWREWSRFTTREKAREFLRLKREATAAYEDETGYESMIEYKIVEDNS